MKLRQRERQHERTVFSGAPIRREARRKYVTGGHAGHVNRARRIHVDSVDDLISVAGNVAGIHQPLAA